MRQEIKQIIKALIETREVAIVDNDFESICNMIDIKAKKTDILEVVYILEAVLTENGIDIKKIYGDL